ncbi:MAG: response regulator [Candidatus Staskawiczbacteria bacterium]
MKVLIVEDEEILYLVLKEKFTNAGHEVMVAVDGDQALPMAIEFKPDVILLDLVLPKKNGLDVLKELKSNFNLKLIPVVILSNLDGDETIEKAISLGAISYLLKTQYPIDTIIEKVEVIFSNSKQ